MKAARVCVRPPMALLEDALKAISELYPSDTMAPGVVLAWLPSTREFYASFVRYQQGFIQIEKDVLASAKSKDFLDVIPALVKNWHDGTTAARRLARIARASKQRLSAD